MKNKTFLFLDSSQVGGIESHVLVLAEALKNKGNGIEILLWKNYGDHPMVEKAGQLQIPVVYLNGSFKALLRLLKLECDAVLHTHGYKASILGKLAGKIVGRPVVATYHAGEPGTGRVRFYRQLDMKTAFLCKGIAVSQAIQNEIRNEGVRTVDNFIRGVDRKTNRCTQYRVGFVGRLSEEKGPDVFLELARRMPEINFIVAGDGHLAQSLKQQAPHNLRFLGQVNNVKAVWDSIDLLCITSRSEGLPMTLLEAMAAGVPAVSFDVGGISSVISDGENGFLCEPGQLEQFEKKIRQWYAKSEKSKLKLVHNALATISNRYTADARLKDITAVYQEAFQEVLCR